MPEYFVGFHFALFTFTNLIHCRRRLLFASGHSSSMNGIKCKAIPCSAFGTLEQPPTTHLAGIISTIIELNASTGCLRARIICALSRNEFPVWRHSDCFVSNLFARFLISFFFLIGHSKRDNSVPKKSNSTLLSFFRMYILCKFHRNKTKISHIGTLSSLMQGKTARISWAFGGERDNLNACAAHDSFPVYPN